MSEHSKDKPITKSQLCWVLIRLVGLYFLYSGFAMIIPLLVLLGNPGPTFSSFASISVPSVLLFIIVGYYLVWNGKTIHRCLMMESNVEPPSEHSFASNEAINNQGVEPMMRQVPKASGPKEQVVVDPRTGLTANETTAFAAWIKDNQGFQNRDELDQIALFRDFQAKS